MNALWELPAYWLNFLLHTALLSVFVWCMCLILRDPGRRAFAAAAGLLFIALLPWITAKGLLLRESVPARHVQESSPIPEDDFSGWVVRIEKPVQVAQLSPVEIMAVPKSGPSIATGWSAVLVGFWISGAIIGFIVLVVRHAALSIRLRSLRKPDDSEWATISQHATRPRQAFLISGNGMGPCAVGILRQRIVLPVEMVAEAGGRMRWAVRHEEEHLRSSDPRVAVFLSLAKSALWWNPLVHLLGYIWIEGREHVCDARALGRPEEGRNYGAFLLEMAEAGSASGGLSMAGGGARRLGKRIRALVGGARVAPKSSASRFGTMALLAGGGLLACCFGVEENQTPPPAVNASGVKVMDAPEKPIMEKEGVNDGAPVRITQTKINSMFLRSGFPLPEAGSVLSEVDKGLMMRRVAQMKGVDLLTTPAVVAKEGNTAETCVITTRPEDAGVEIGKAREVPFVGISLKATPEFKGAKVSLSVDCLVNDEPGQKPLEWIASPGFPEGRLRIPPKDFDWTTVRSATAVDTRELSAGECMVVAFKGTPEGVHLTGIFTALPIDATGRDYDSFDQEAARLKPEPSPPYKDTGEGDRGAGDGNDRRQIKLTSKLILADGEIPVAGKALKDTEVMALFAKLSKEASVKLRTAPSVMFRSGQRSKVEVFRSPPDAQAQADGDVDNRSLPFAGVSLESTAKFAGDKIEVDYDALYKHQSGKPNLFFADGNFPEELPADFDWSKLRSSQAKGRIALKPGETFVAPFANAEPGKHLYVAFSVLEIDATGRPVGADGNTYDPPRLRRDGKFRVRSSIVTLPAEGRLPSYWFQIPAFPDVPRSPSSAILYPTRYLADIRKEAVAAGGMTAWEDTGDVIAGDGEEVSQGKGYPSAFRGELWGETECQIRMDLPGHEGKVGATGYLGHILGVELAPTGKGNRRVFILALDEVK
jgi:beta-lactamase regulating signal transducer with metallopeptidase domain